MSKYFRNCLIGKIEFNPRKKYGVLYTTDRWRSILNQAWKILGRESSIPVDASDYERDYFIYTFIRDFAIRSGIVIGVIAVYALCMRYCSF